MLLTPMIFSLLIILLIALATDLTQHKIPNQLILFGLILGFLAQCFTTAGAGGVHWLIGMALGFIGFFPLYLIKGMAAGDVKLMMVVGGFLGYPLIVTALAYTVILGGIFAILLTIYRGKLIPVIQNLTRMTKLMAARRVHPDITQNTATTTITSSAGKMPYAPAILVGTLLAILHNPIKQAVF